MNETGNNFLLARNKFIPQMHLRQSAACGKPGITYSACGPFNKIKERIKKS